MPCALRCVGAKSLLDNCRRRSYRSAKRALFHTKVPYSYGLQVDFSVPLSDRDLGGVRYRRRPEDAIRCLTAPAKLRLETLQVQLEMMKVGTGHSRLKIPDVNLISARQWLDLLRCKDSQSLDLVLHWILLIQRNGQKDLQKCPEILDSALPALTVADIRWFYNKRLEREAPFSDAIFVDMAFDSVMSPESRSLLRSEVRNIVSVNRSSKQPFQVKFCGRGLTGSKQLDELAGVFDVAGDARLGLDEQGQLKALHESTPYDIIDGCFTSQIPAGAPIENIIYIVPGCGKLITAYDPSCFYVLPGYSYRDGSLWRVAIERAKSLGLAYRALPVLSLKSPSMVKSVRSLLQLKNRAFFDD